MHLNLKVAVSARAALLCLGALILTAFGGFGAGHHYGKASSSASSAPGVQLVQDDKTHKPSYHCADDHIAIQVPLGNTVQADGSTYKLDHFGQEADPRHQQKVVLTMTIKNRTASSIIVETAAHNTYPRFYSNKFLQVGLAPGATGTYELPTRAYTENFFQDGITAVTVCMK